MADELMFPVLHDLNWLASPWLLLLIPIGVVLLVPVVRKASVQGMYGLRQTISILASLLRLLASTWNSVRRAVATKLSPRDETCAASARVEQPTPTAIKRPIKVRPPRIVPAVAAKSSSATTHWTSQWRGLAFGATSISLGVWLAWHPLVWAGQWLHLDNPALFAVLSEAVMVSGLVWASNTRGGWKWKALRVIGVLGYAGSYVKLQHLAAQKLTGAPWVVDAAHPIAWAFWAPWIWPLSVDIAGLIAGAIAWEEAEAGRSSRYATGMAIACTGVVILGNALPPEQVPSWLVDAMFPGSVFASAHMIWYHAPGRRPRDGNDAEETVEVEPESTPDPAAPVQEEAPRTPNPEPPSVQAGPSAREDVLALLRELRPPSQGKAAQAVQDRLGMGRTAAIEHVQRAWRTCPELDPRTPVTNGNGEHHES